jgi:2-oxoisovalerate dehydrogenase E1 component
MGVGLPDTCEIFETECSNMEKDVLCSLYRQMLLIRRCEEQMVKAHQLGLVPGPCHTYIGQEAIASGICAHLRRDDVVFSTHRGHGHALAKGVAPREVMAELFGRKTGCSRGRGGSMHLFAPELGLMGTSGIVGPNILQAVGAGYTFKLLKTDRVSVAFFGDGAVSNGAFHEGLNMAAIWNLPVLFVCENNQYATEVPFEYATRNPHVGERGAAYGIEGAVVDGNDVVAVHDIAGAAIARARSEGGPTLLECKTYRTRPHAEGMGDGDYRTQEEVDAWKERDPIRTFHARLLADHGLVESELADLEEEVGAVVREGFEFAKNSPWPEAETATRFVFSES